MAQSKPKTTITAATKDSPRLQPQVWFNNPLSNYPDAGWNHAIEGFAIKLAEKLGYEPCMVSYRPPLDPPAKGIKLIQIDVPEGQTPDEVLKPYLEKHGAPAIWLGGYGRDAGPLGKLPYRCDARPDLGVSWSIPAITHLTPQRIQQAGARASHLAEWNGKLHGKKVLINVAQVPQLATIDDTNPLLREVKHLLAQQDDFTLMITSSPRTDAMEYECVMNAVNALVEEAKAGGKQVDLIAQSYHECSHSAYLAQRGKADEIPNRYEEMLGIADAVMVLGESRSMLSDALLTNAAIYVQDTYVQGDVPGRKVPAAERFQKGLDDVFGGGQTKGRITGGSFDGQTIKKPKGVKPLDISQYFVEEELRDYQAFCRNHPERVPLQTPSKSR